MFEWCKNRLEITGRSVFVDVMQQWVAGQQSIKLLLAGAAGVLKPVKNVEYRPFPGLVSHGIAYAEDFDPRLPENEDGYENANFEVGDDDLGEYLGKDFWETPLKPVIHRGCDAFIDVSEKHIRTSYLEG